MKTLNNLRLKNSLKNDGEGLQSPSAGAAAKK